MQLYTVIFFTNARIAFFHLHKKSTIALVRTTTAKENNLFLYQIRFFEKLFELNEAKMIVKMNEYLNGNFMYRFDLLWILLD